MKTIILPTDFSEASEKALEYSIKMAKLLDARIIVTNTYYVPGTSPDLPVLLPEYFYREAKKDSEAKMKMICERINQEKNSAGKNILSEYKYEYETAVSAIVELAEEKEADLIIMGTRSNEHFMRFFESTTLNVAHLIPCPLLIVQKESIYHSFKNIYFALKDLDKDILSTTKIINLFRPYNSVITLFHISEDDTKDESDLEEETALIFMNAVKEKLGYSRIRFKRIHEKVLSDEVTHYLADSEPDLIVILKQNRSWFKEIFHKSMTKFLLSNFTTPVLILPQIK